HLDVADEGRLERRRRHECELTGYTREGVGRRLEGGVDLSPQLREVEREDARPLILSGKDAARIQPVTLLGRDPPGGRVRMREEPPALELRKLVAHRGG